MKRDLAPLLLVVILALGFIYGYGLRSPKMETSTLLVFGAPVNSDGSMSAMLGLRCQVALDYLNEHPKAQALLLGGGERGLSESRAMADFLEDQGISPSRLSLEERSTSTWTNLLEAKKLLEEIGLEPIVTACSSDFHLFRINFLAKRLGLEVQPLPAKTPMRYVAYSYLRELLAIVKSFFLDH